MGLLSLVGHFLVGVGPSLVFYIFFIARRSFVVLVTLASAFYYLSVLLVISALFRGLAPLPATAGSRAGVLIASVALEEGARYLLWMIHRLTTNILSNAARKMGRAWTATDALFVSLGFGFGQGAAHAVFFFLAVLPLLEGEATYYLDSCPQMSYFLSLALSVLAFTILHASGTVIFFSGLSDGSNGPRVWAPPILHLVAALCTLLRFLESGCVGAVSAVLAISLPSGLWAGMLAMAKSKRRTGLDRLSQ